MNTYALHRPKFFIINDTPMLDSAPLQYMFRDAHTMFQMRVKALGNLARPTNDADGDTLRVMLEGLIQAKKHLANN